MKHGPLQVYRNYFAKLIAIKTSIAVMLSILFTLLLGFHDGTDYAWFAPFCVIVSLIGLPLEARRISIIWQRAAGMLLGSGLALIGAILLRPAPIYMLVYAVFFTLIFNYFVGKQHKLSYFFTLGFIYLDLLTCFIYAKPEHFYGAILHFPFMIIIALITVSLSELVIPQNMLKKKAPEMVLQSFALVREHLGDIAHHKINTQWFSYLERVLQSVQSQMKNEQFSKIYNNAITLKSISFRLNEIATALSHSEGATKTFLPELKNITRLIDTILNNSIHDQAVETQYLNEALTTLKQRVSQSEFNKDECFNLAIEEFNQVTEQLCLLNQVPENTITQPTQTKKDFSYVALWFALRVTFAIIAANFVIAYFNLPGDYQAFIIATTIAAIPYGGRIFYKFALRVAGVFLAGLLALGLGLLLVKVDSIILTSITVILFGYLGTRWTFKFDRESYAGVQFGLVFILLLLANGNAHYGINMNLYKFEAVMIASIIALVINLIVAPKLP